MPAVAIVGMSCQYPGARSPEELWENVLARRRAFRRMPPERLRLDDYACDDPTIPDTTYVKQAALIEGYEFDRVRFRVAGSTFREADMAHWLALEVAADALADAGFPEGENLPKESCGVLVGNSLTGEFSRANLLRLRWPYVRRVVEARMEDRGWAEDDRAAFLEDLEQHFKSPFPAVGDDTLAGGLSNTIAGRISNFFDFKGGGYTVDGACASSLLAVASACSALGSGDLDVALAGGVDLSLDPFELVGFARLGALAADEMRVYDARPTGFLPGEGCGFVVLMRHEDALARQLPIHAVIRGWGISSDGSGGITRPEADGQLLALQRAYRRAGFGIETVAYFEGHGTGTGIGDQTELTVLTQALNENPSAGTPAVIGSIKANIGHTKAAAGVAGILKASLALEHQLLPPGTGWVEPHPLLADQRTTLRLLRRGEPWPDDRPLRAGVSGMGFGGINVHVVLENPEKQRRAALRPREQTLLSSYQDAELFLINGADREDVRCRVERLLSYAGRLSQSELADLANALATAEMTSGGRGSCRAEGSTAAPQERRPPAAPVRAAIVAGTAAELESGLDKLLSWLDDGVETQLDIRAGVMLGQPSTKPNIGFFFPGQGSPANLDGGAWRDRFDFIRDLYREAGLPAQSDGIATEVAQPAIVTASLGGLRLLERMALRASVAVGHSLGELTAYQWAGAIDETALLRLATARGRAMSQHARGEGAMASIAAGQSAVEALFLDDPVLVAGINSPRQTVISGEVAAVESVIARARAAQLTAVRLPVSHAFHSPLVADSIPALARAIAAEEWHPLRHAVASTITGTLLTGDDQLGALLERQMTSPVRFMEAVRAVTADVDLWIEVGPGHVLGRLARDLTDTPAVSLDVGGASLRPVLQVAGTAFVLGAELDRRALFEGRFTRPFDLDWRPRFFANPCESAPQTAASPSQTKSGSEKLSPDLTAASLGALGPDSSPLEVVRQLAAARAELPVAAVKENYRLLDDLHLSSLAVGQLVVEAARALGLPPPASPTDAANATVAQVAAVLEELARHQAAGPAGPTEPFPAGVDTWTRAFTVELVERELPPPGSGPLDCKWRVMTSPGHPLRRLLLRALVDSARVPDDARAELGVVVCLPPNPGEKQIELLLEAAREILAKPEASRFVLVQHGGGAAGFARSLHLEHPEVTTCVVDVPVDHPHAVDWILTEIRSASGYVEAHYDAEGKRRQPVLKLLPLDHEPAALPMDDSDVLLVTGGGKGIASESAFVLARQTGARLALMGRSRPSDDNELAANLARMADAGIRFEYVTADVTDRQAVAGAIRQVQESIGPVTALLHGAGTNQPQRLETVDREAFLRTVRPKVEGARNVLAAVDPQRLRWLITFGSIIARTGMHGQADYAVANEWLTRVTAEWQAKHPDCRCLAIEWSVWSGVGMGERLGTVDFLRRQGITPIPADEGLRMLVRLLRQPLPRVGIVVTGRFGEPPTLKLEPAELPLLRFLERPRIHVPGVELVVDAELSPDTDPYVNDHVFQGESLVPAVMGLEAMAQASMGLSGASRPPTFQDVRFEHPVVVPKGERLTIRIAALVRAPNEVEVVLRSEQSDFQSDHFCAVCRFDDEPAGIGGQPSLVADAPANGAPVPLDPARDLYGKILFQSGRFCRVKRYRHLRATECVAEIASGPTDDWFGPYLPASLVLGDPGARDAALHAVQACIPHGTLLPTGVARLIPGEVGQVIDWVYARERSRDGDDFVYDLELVGVDGNVVERWEGLHLRRVGRLAENGSWPAPLLSPYIERRVGELAVESAVSVAVEYDDTLGRRARSDLAIQHSLGATAAVHRRPDGKPEVDGDRQVSATHAGGLTMAVAGRGAIACDAEAVAPHSAEDWRDLLGSQRYTLAKTIAAQATEDADTAATRVWAANECLKKAGAGFESPLVFRSSTDDHWVLLATGTLVIATWVGAVREEDGNRLVFAVLEESCSSRLVPVATT